MLGKLYDIGIFGYFCQGMAVDIRVYLLCALGVLLCIGAGYFLGSVNTAIIVSKLFYGEDIRNYGSGNAGLTNVLRTYGKKAAALTLVGDILKTVLAVVIGRFIGLPIVMGIGQATEFYRVISVGGYIAGLFAAVGHTFPIYYKFKGGKGVLCAATVVAMLSPSAFFWLIIIFIIILFGTKFVSLGSVIAVMLYPLVLSKINGPSIEVIFAFLMMLLVVYNHRENIKRLLAGTENKFSIGSKRDKKKDDPDEDEDEDDA